MAKGVSRGCGLGWRRGLLQSARPLWLGRLRWRGRLGALGEHLRRMLLRCGGCWRWGRLRATCRHPTDGWLGLASCKRRKVRRIGA